MAKKKAEAVTTQVNIKGVSTETIQKLQVIAGMEGVSTQEVYKKAFETYVGLYEQKNGKIKIKEKGSGLDVI
jgi:hypothetical protein